MIHIKLKNYVPPFIVGHASAYSEVPDLRSLVNACHIKKIFWMLEMVAHHGPFSQPDLKQSLASF